MTKYNQSFSVVVPTYRRLDALSKCLDCLSSYFVSGTQERLGIILQVIVTDDDNDPELRVFLQERYPWCLYTSGPQRGPAANRNNGARIATSEWLVFTDDDCLPQTGWIEAYAFSSDQSDVLEGRTSAEGSQTRIDEECPINEEGGLLWSCNFAIRRNIFFELGGFNETFPAPAMEDVELNVRINKQALPRRFVRLAVVLHPWRRRKGILYVKSHATSVAKFVRLHPEQASNFSLSSQFHKCLISVKNNSLHAILNHKFKGLFRQIFLDCYANITTWKAINL